MHSSRLQLHINTMCIKATENLSSVELDNKFYFLSAAPFIAALGSCPNGSYQKVILWQTQKQGKKRHKANISKTTCLLRLSRSLCRLCYTQTRCHSSRLTTPRMYQDSTGKKHTNISQNIQSVSFTFSGLMFTL